MAQNIDLNDARKRGKKKKKYQKILIFVILAAIVVSLYLNRESWIPKLEGIGSRYITITQNDGKKSAGNFPLSISGNGECQVCSAADKLMILSEDTLYEYSASGKLDRSWKHSLSNTVMVANGERVLLYEEGDTKFKVYGKNNKLYDDEVSDPIIFAKISNEGYTAVVFESDTFSCVINVYNDEGKLVYTRECLERISDITFTGKSTGYIMSSIDAADGNVKTKLTAVKFDSKKDIWATDKFDMLCMSLYTDSDGYIWVIGSNRTLVFNSSGESINEYNYNQDLAGYSVANGKAALLLQDNIRHKMRLVTFASPDAKAIEIDSSSTVHKIHIYGNSVYVLDSDGLKKYNFNGEISDNFGINDTYKDFVHFGNFTYLINDEKIDRSTF